MNKAIADRLTKFVPSSLASRQPELVRALVDTTGTDGTATVNDIQSKLALTAPQIARGDVVQFLQKLERAAATAGKFVVGRKGKPSRFVWYSHIINDGPAADTAQPAVATTERSLPIAPMDEPAQSDRSTLHHSYNLRPDFQIQLVLPADLTQREAERLSGFIKSLPIE